MEIDLDASTVLVTTIDLVASAGRDLENADLVVVGLDPFDHLVLGQPIAPRLVGAVRSCKGWGSNEKGGDRN